MIDLGKQAGFSLATGMLPKSGFTKGKSEKGPDLGSG